MGVPPKLGFKKQRVSDRFKKLKVTGDLNGIKRQVIDIDVVIVYNLARQMCTQEEIAGILGCPVDKFRELARSTQKLGDALEAGYADTREVLRKKQLELALDGHPSMLMWLGKQYLGQADKAQVNTSTQISVTVQRAQEQLNNIPTEQLLAARDALRGGLVIDGETGEEIPVGEAGDQEGQPPV